MFLQIVEWIVKFVGILNDTEKLTTSQNRKRIGKSLVELHTILARISDNVVRIRAELARTQEGMQEGKSAYFGSLILRLGDQRQLLNTLQDVLRSQRELVDIYGDDCGKEIARVTAAKMSLIDLIVSFSLHCANNLWWSADKPQAEYLPKTFDLNDIVEFKKELEQGYGRYGDFQMLLSRRHGVVPMARFAVEVGKDPAQDARLVALLLSQIDSMQTVERLDQARTTIADILKKHFKMEEVF